MTDYYVRPVTGSDGNAGTSSGAAWATFQKALDTATGGDVVYLWAEATETTTATIAIDAQNGSAGSPITFEGRDATGAAPASYTIQATATWGGGSLVARTTGFGKNLTFRDIIFDGNNLATSSFDDNESASQNAGLRISFENCDFINASSHGYDTQFPVTTSFLNCRFQNNGGNGFNSTSTSDGRVSMTLCVFSSNATSGCFMDHSLSVFTHCDFYLNGQDGLFLQARSDETRVLFCNFYDNNDDGIDMAGTSLEDCIIQSCAIVGNGGYGIKFGTSTAYLRHISVSWNCYYQNTSGSTDQTSTPPGRNNITSDPMFNAAGSGDFRPTAGSPLIQAGPLYTNIGNAVQDEGGASAGTRVYAI